jgi:hypothetical protein
MEGVSSSDISLTAPWRHFPLRHAAKPEVQIMHIRQIALVAHDLEPTLETLCDGLEIEVGFRDPGISTFGLQNALMPIGDDFLEVVSPTEDGTTAGRLLDRRKAAGAHEEGDGGYMVIFQSSDLEADRTRMKNLGIRIVWEIAFDDIATLHLHPRDVGAAIVSLDCSDPPESWRWAGPQWRDHRRTGRVTGIAGATLAANDPAAMAARWAEVIGHEPCELDDGHPGIQLDRDQQLRFVPAHSHSGEALVGLDLKSAPGTEPAELNLAGMCIRLV